MPCGKGVHKQALRPEAFNAEFVQVLQVLKR
jgi:hypothetical protein